MNSEVTLVYTFLIQQVFPAWPATGTPGTQQGENLNY